MLRKGLWGFLCCSLTVLVAHCGDDSKGGGDSGAGSPVGGAAGRGGALTGGSGPGGSSEGGSSGDDDSSGGGSSARAGSSGAAGRGGAAGLGGSTGAGQGGGAGAGDSGGGAAGDSMGGEGGLGGEGGESDGGNGGSGGSAGGGSGGSAGGAGESGCMDPPPVGACTNDLSFVGTGDFEIKFTITTSSQEPAAAVLSQRGICDHSYFWAVRYGYGGFLWLELDEPEGRNYFSCFSSVGVDDGVPHRVVMRRIAGVVSIDIDCRGPDFCSSATDLSGALAPLGGPSADPCIWEPGYMAIEGTVSGVCVRPL